MSNYSEIENQFVTVITTIKNTWRFNNQVQMSIDWSFVEDHMITSTPTMKIVVNGKSAEIVLGKSMVSSHRYLYVWVPRGGGFGHNRELSVDEAISLINQFVTSNLKELN